MKIKLPKLFQRKKLSSWELEMMKIIERQVYDVSCFFQDIPYMRLMKKSGAETYISKMALDVGELKTVLNQYPNVLYEPLDDVYLLMRYLATTNETVINDLLLLGWRGAVIASWLISLKPDDCYLEALLKIKGKYTENDWLVCIAIAEIQNELTDNHQIHKDIKTVREHLLDKLPSAKELPKPDFLIFEHSKKIEKMYKKHGAEKTILYIQELKNKS